MKIKLAHRGIHSSASQPDIKRKWFLFLPVRVFPLFNTQPVLPDLSRAFQATATEVHQGEGAIIVHRIFIVYSIFVDLLIVFVLDYSRFVAHVTSTMILKLLFT